MGDEISKEQEYLAQVLCAIAGIHPIEPLDGSSNWWIFSKQAGEIVADIQKRFPKPPEPTAN